MIGKTISHYKILEKIGEGGMGVVYKARDIKLKRIVALKFLSLQTVGGAEGKSRFFHEAQIAASLDHPNICSVYEIDEVEGQVFISMAYIEGQSLKEKIESGPLKVDEFIDLALQIADGLEEAHERGIIHRDIKTSNIMVTDKGQVKIMDFGLAKSSFQTKITKTGTTLGTVGYMSPEQVRGEEIDFRSDIWSLGVVFYELITGHLPFRGEHEQPVMYSILHRQPEPVTSLRTGVPIELERIVMKCLEKNPPDRFHSLADLKTDMRRLKRDIQNGTATTVRVSPEKKPWFLSRKSWLFTGLGVLAAAVIFTLISILFQEKAPPSAVDFAQLTSSGGLALYPSWSPDGNWIVYASDESGNMDIWKKPINGGQDVRLTSSEYNEIQPAWSPDGEIIAFSSDREGGGIYLVHAEGGTPYRLTSFGLNPTWSPDSRIIAFDWQGDIYLVPKSEEKPPELLIKGTSASPHMAWSPDGEKMIFWNRTKGDMFIIRIDSGKSSPLRLIPSGEEVSGISWSKNGRYLVYSKGPFGGNKNLWLVELDPKTARPVREPVALTSSITDDIQCCFAPDGKRLAFAIRNLERHLWAIKIDSEKAIPMDGAIKLTYRGKQNYYPALSPDGRKVAWTSHLAAKGSIYYRSLDEESERKVTYDWGNHTREVGASFSPDGEQISFSSTVEGSYEIWRVPSLGSLRLQLTETEHPIRDSLTAWSPLGDVIAFYSNRSGNWDIWCTESTRKGKPWQLTKWESNENYPCWSPDGSKIAFRTDKEGNPDIWIMEKDGSNPRPYVTHPAEEGWGAWSPDYRWFYFTSNRDGVFNIWAMPSEGGEAHQVTDYDELSFGMPEAVLYTKFAVSEELLVLPLESRKGDIYILRLK
ncbi:MAG: protein kinase [Candidatus Aminicenantales bacterium]